MVKKTKTTQQRSKEEQWRKRMAAQAQRTGGFAGDATSGAATDMMGDGAGEMSAPPSPRPRPATTMTAPGRTQARTATATQRRTATSARTSRMRLTANALTIEEEMRYVRSDIRRLIILTAICLAVIIALSFIIPR
ncbi:MAG TPA: hypothetical protein VEX13_02550 [Chloroflexia bacterium]|nr:hypothetical protein [Chloroflexia bacterium]